MVGRRRRNNAGRRRRGYTMVELAVATVLIGALMASMLGVASTVLSTRSQSMWVDQARAAAGELLDRHSSRAYLDLASAGQFQTSDVGDVRGVAVTVDVSAQPAGRTVPGGWAPAWVDLTATVYPDVAGSDLSPVTVTRRVSAGDLVSGTDRATVTVVASGPGLAAVGDISSLPPVRLVDGNGATQSVTSARFDEHGRATVWVDDASAVCTRTDPCRIAIGDDSSTWWATSEWTLDATAAVGAQGRVVVGPGEQIRHAVGLARTSQVEVRLFAQVPGGPARIAPSASGESPQVCLWARFPDGLGGLHVDEYCNDQSDDVVTIASYTVSSDAGPIELPLPGGVDIELFGADPDLGEEGPGNWGIPDRFGPSGLSTGGHDPVAGSWPTIGRVAAPSGGAGGFDLTWTWPNGGPATGIHGYTARDDRPSPSGAFAHLPLDDPQGSVSLEDRAAGNDFGTTSTITATEFGAPARSTDGSTSVRLDRTSAPALLLDMRSSGGANRTAAQVAAARLQQPFTIAASVLLLSNQHDRISEIAAWAASPGWWLTVDNDTGQVRFVTGQNHNDSGVSSNTGVIRHDRWHDIAVVVEPDGSTLDVQFVVDGAPAGGGTIDAVPIGSTTRVDLGRMLEGNLAHVALFASARTVSDLAGWRDQMQTADAPGGAYDGAGTWALPRGTSNERPDCVVLVLAYCDEFDPSVTVLYGAVSAGSDTFRPTSSTVAIASPEPGVNQSVSWTSGMVSHIDGSSTAATSTSTTADNPERILTLASSTGSGSFNPSGASSVSMTRFNPSSPPVAALQAHRSRHVVSQQQLADGAFDAAVTALDPDGNPRQVSAGSVSVSGPFTAQADGTDILIVPSGGMAPAGVHDVTVSTAGVSTVLSVDVRPTVGSIDLTGDLAGVGRLDPVPQGSDSNPGAQPQVSFTPIDLNGDVAEVPVRAVAVGGPDGSVSTQLASGAVSTGASRSAPARDGYQLIVEAGTVRESLIFEVTPAMLRAEIDAPEQVSATDGTFEIAVVPLDGAGAPMAATGLITVTVDGTPMTATDEGDGRYTVQVSAGSLPSGSVGIVVADGGGQILAQTRTIVVPTADSVTMPSPDPVPAGAITTLTGEAFAFDGSPAAGTTFAVTVDSQVPTVQVAREVTVDDDGQFSIPWSSTLRAAPGDYTITVTAPEGATASANVTVTDPVAALQVDGAIRQGAPGELTVRAQTPDGRPAPDLSMTNLSLSRNGVDVPVSGSLGLDSTVRGWAVHTLLVDDPGPIVAGTWTLHATVSAAAGSASGRIELPVRVAPSVGDVHVPAGTVTVGQNQTRTVEFDVTDLAGNPMRDALVDITIAGDGLMIGPGTAPSGPGGLDDLRDHVRVRTSPSGRGQVALQAAVDVEPGDAGTLTINGEADITVHVAPTITRLSASTLTVSASATQSGLFTVCAFDLGGEPAVGVPIEMSTADVGGPRAIPMQRTAATGDDGCARTRFQIPSGAVVNDTDAGTPDVWAVRVSAGTIRGLGGLRIVP